MAKVNRNPTSLALQARPTGVVSGNKSNKGQEGPRCRPILMSLAASVAETVAI